MIEAFYAYIKTITALTIFSALACMLIPENSFKKYVELVLGLLVLSTIMTPFFQLFGLNDGRMEVQMMKGGLTYDRMVLEQREYELREEELLIDVYAKELNQKILKDLQETYKEILWIEADFCEEVTEEAFGALEGITIKCKTTQEKEIKKYTAKRYHLALEDIQVIN